jgi:hypothetical protein
MLLVALTAMLAPSFVMAQDLRPELMYFRFDEAGQTVSINKANPATAVVPSGNILNSLTMSGTGQFGTALQAATGTGQFVTNWSTSLGNTGFTISFWLVLPPNPNNTLNYLFGDNTAGSFRCFEGGVAYQGGLFLRGPITDVVIPQGTIAANTPAVVHYVYDKPLNVIRAYVNGTLVVSQSQPANFSIAGTNLRISGYSSGQSMLLGTSLDEFRIYSRALTAQEVTDSWDTDVDCFIPDGRIDYSILDANLQPTTFTNVPGLINLRYSVTYPDEAANVGITVNFRNVISNTIVYTYAFNATKLDGQPLTGIETIPIPGSVPSGYLEVEVIFNTKNSCSNYEDYIAPSSTLLLLPPGAVMCIVWPGDTDNDGVVNYADRRALNTYIHEANLRSSWLEGPTRFSVIGGLDYLEWKAQPSAPWQTPEGCYMDTDGNGFINNFDYIAIKLNWMRMNDGGGMKPQPGFDAVSFDMDQNYPNPFNPSTSIRYAVPERSQVRLVVTDMLGREVATLVDDAVEAGVHNVMFDAAGLSSGNYIATVRMSGLASGLTFSKTITMALNK